MKLENQETKTKKAIKKEEVVVKKESVKATSLEEKIQEWKAQFGRVYKNTIDGETIIWRAIRRGEYRSLLATNEDIDASVRLLAKQESTVTMAVLYPEDIADLIEQKAGLATVLSEEILAKSGFDISETEAL